MRFFALALFLLLLALPARAQESRLALSPEREVFVLLTRLAHLLAPRAAPQTYVVAPTGDNAAPCTEAQPCRTIAHGLSRLASGDTLLLRGGTYNEALHYSVHTIPSGTSWQAATTLASSPGETAVLKPTSSSYAAVVTLKGSYLLLDRLTIDATHTRYGLSTLYTDHLRFQHGEIRYSGKSRTPSVPFNPGEDEAELVEMGGSFNEVIGSLLHSSPHSYGFYVFGGHDNVIAHNTIRDNGGFAVQVYDGSYPSSRSDRHRITHNVISGNGHYRQYGALTIGSGSDHVIANNLIVDNFGGIWAYKNGTGSRYVNNTLVGNTHWGIQVYAGNTGSVLTNNILWQNGSAIDDLGSGTVQQTNLTGDPLFVGSGDYHLRAGSPGIDTGTAVAAVTTDLDGAARPQGAGYDIGAYESASATPPDPPQPPAAGPWAVTCQGVVGPAAGVAWLRCQPAPR